MTNTFQTVNKRVAKNKELIIEQLKKVPIVQVACEKIGIGRATYYRWRKDDEIFTESTDSALTTGREFMNDIAESQLIKAIQNNDLTAIIFWLKNNHKQYSNRLELTAEVKNLSQPMSTEQEELVKKALELASLIHPLEVVEIKDHGI